MRPLISAALVLVCLVTEASAEPLDPKEVFARIQPALAAVTVATVRGKAGRATGFFISPTVVVTNYHVVKDARLVTVTRLGSGRSSPVVDILAADWAGDIAILKIRESPGPHLEVRRRPIPAVGQRVYVIGNPKGLTGSLSDGLVSGIRSEGGRKVIQISAPIAGGSSGSPLVDDTGALIGLVYARETGEQQIGFATPVDRLHALLNDDAVTRGTRELTREQFSSRSIPPPAASPIATSQGDAAEKIRTIRIGVPHWDSANAVAHILQAAIEKRLPYQVDLVRAENEEIFESLEKQDGTYDVHPDVWLPNHEPFLSESKNIVLNDAPYLGRQGICVPRYVAQQLGIKRVHDLMTPGAHTLFDVDGSGKPDLWIGDESWEAARIMRLKARDYGFERVYQLTTWDEARLWDHVEAAFRDHRAIAFYCYEPHWGMEKYQLTMLEEPAYSSDCFALAPAVPSPAANDDSKAGCAFPPARIHVGFSRELAKTAPDLAGLLGAARFTSKEVNRWIEGMGDARALPEVVARRWATENARLIENWTES
ncbi:MAG: glycine betaine ABC transporter substrate-binding protein [Alphaproteobacteria bacterium]